MKTPTLLTALCAVTATASPTLTLTKVAKDSTPDTIDMPICKFDPVKGEYICPAAMAEEMIGHSIAQAKTFDAEIKGDGTVNSTVTKVADCNKCDADLKECMKHWGCWFYDCLNPCRCDVGKKDPQCTTCWSGQC